MLGVQKGRMSLQTFGYRFCIHPYSQRERDRQAKDYSESYLARYTRREAMGSVEEDVPQSQNAFTCEVVMNEWLVDGIHTSILVSIHKPPIQGILSLWQTRA